MQEAHLFLYDGVVHDLGAPAGRSAQGTGINALGQIVGTTNLPQDYSKGFLYSNGVFEIFEPLSGDNNLYVSAINDLGQITGYSRLGGSFPQAFVRTNGVMQGLGFLPNQGQFSVANAINNAGVIVGQALHSASPYGHAVLFSDGAVIDLNAITVGIPAGWHLNMATGINDSGQIAGWATYGTSVPGYARPFLLTPANTLTGSNITLAPKDEATGLTPVTLTFSTVTQSGTTQLITSSSGAQAPFGFKVGQPPVYYDISTTAVYSGPITICIDYSGVSFTNPNLLSIWHFDSGAGSWTKLETTLNPTSMTACAPTPSLSPFALFQPMYSAKVEEPIKADGTSIFSANRGVVPVRFSLSFGDARTCNLPAAVVAISRTTGGASASVAEDVYVMPPDSGSNFRSDGCHYFYNLAASALGPGIYRVDILVGGSFAGAGIFALK